MFHGKNLASSEEDETQDLPIWMNGFIRSIGGKGGEKVVAAYHALCIRMEEGGADRKRILLDEIRDYLGDKNKKIENGLGINRRDLAVAFGIKLLTNEIGNTKIEGTDLASDLANTELFSRWDQALISAAKVGGGDKKKLDGTPRNSRFEMFGDQHAIHDLAGFIMIAAERNSSREDRRYVAEAARAVMLYSRTDDHVLRALRLRENYCGVADGTHIAGNHLGLGFARDIGTLMLRSDLNAVKDFCRDFIYKMFADAIAKQISFGRVVGFLAAESVATALSWLSEAQQAALKNLVSDMFNYVICKNKSFEDVERLLVMPIEDVLVWLGPRHVSCLFNTAINQDTALNRPLRFKQLLNAIADEDETAPQRKVGYWLMFVAVVLESEEDEEISKELYDHTLRAIDTFGEAVGYLSSMLAINVPIDERYLDEIPDKYLRDFKSYMSDKQGIAEDVKEFINQLVRSREANLSRKEIRERKLGFAKLVQKELPFCEINQQQDARFFRGLTNGMGELFGDDYPDPEGEQDQPELERQNEMDLLAKLRKQIKYYANRRIAVERKPPLRFFNSFNGKDIARVVAIHLLSAYLDQGGKVEDLRLADDEWVSLAKAPGKEIDKRLFSSRLEILPNEGRRVVEGCALQIILAASRMAREAKLGSDDDRYTRAARDAVLRYAQSSEQVKLTLVGSEQLAREMNAFPNR